MNCYMNSMNWAQGGSLVSFLLFPHPGTPLADIPIPFWSKDVCFWSTFLHFGHFYKPEGVDGVFFWVIVSGSLGSCPYVFSNLHLSAIILWVS
ncbi:hypothetical protein BJY00DRAFT_48664 [Aspergillus carlsbadensis]|nr:hypothetical protein BJY00DRAFT_48664 [Aspergillus carlsbadensis]